MTIRSVIDAIVTIEQGLSITSPVNLSVKKALESFPDVNQPMPETDLPCWLNQWEVLDSDWLPGDQREVTYEVHMSLLVGRVDVELSRRLDIASAFWEALLNSLADSVNLGVSGRLQKVRRAQQGALQVFGLNYAGLDVWLEVLVSEANA